MNADTLKLKMFGGFSIQYNNRDFLLDRASYSKTTQLFQLLALHKKDGISKAALMDALYGRDQVENKNASLNNTIFRLRRQLKHSGLPEDDYITITGGTCFWTGAISPDADCLDFEELIRQGQNTDDMTLRRNLYLKACQMYTGEFLPDMLGEDWAAVTNVRYKKLYCACLTELLELLKEAEMHQAVYDMSGAACQLYPLENWQLYMLDSLIAMGRYQEAMKLYKDTVALFLDELGISPSPEILKRFRFLSSRISHAESALEDIRQRLSEKETPEGGYFCTLPSFIDLYRTVSRMMERNGISVFLMLCTIRPDSSRSFGQTSGERELSARLCETIRFSTRKGDFYTRYNAGQYLVVLSGIDREHCHLVSDRIDHKVSRIASRNNCSLAYHFSSIADIFQDMDPEQLSFCSAGSFWK